MDHLRGNKSIHRECWVALESSACVFCHLLERDLPGKLSSREELLCRPGPSVRLPRLDRGNRNPEVLSVWFSIEPHKLGADHRTGISPLTC